MKLLTSKQSWGRSTLLNSVVDNDIVEKFCRWNSSGAIADCLRIRMSRIGYLGSLRFVIGKRLAESGNAEALDDLEVFLHAASELVPSEAELALAATFQEIPLPKGLTLDEGESILFSAAVLRALNSVLTGDKRAICCCAEMTTSVDEVGVLKGRLISLEQLLGTLIQILGQDEVRKRVCSDKTADKTAAICFSCGAESLVEGSAMQALKSYQSDLTSKSEGFSSKTLSCCS